MDLTSSYHNFSIWRQTGIVTYAVDNSVIYSGAAVAYGGTPILIGDPSGTDPGDYRLHVCGSPGHRERDGFRQCPVESR